MIDWKARIIENAKGIQSRENTNSLEDLNEFPEDMDSPEKLMEFFIANYIYPLAEEILKINKDFYAINQSENKVEIQIIDKILWLKNNTGTLYFAKVLDNNELDLYLAVSIDTVLAVGKPHVSFKDLTLEHLNQVMIKFSE